MFYTCLSFCPRGGSVPVHAGIHHPGRHPRADTTPWADNPPALVHSGIHPLPNACWDTHGYCCGRYTSYWNAFLFYNNVLSGKIWKNSICYSFFLRIPNCIRSNVLLNRVFFLIEFNGIYRIYRIYRILFFSKFENENYCNLQIPYNPWNLKNNFLSNFEND